MTAISASADPGRELDLEVTLGVTSDYRFRGESLSGRRRLFREGLRRDIKVGSSRVGLRQLPGSTSIAPSLIFMQVSNGWRVVFANGIGPRLGRIERLLSIY
jgi:hypothetical protein